MDLGDYLCVFRPTTRGRWDWVTPIALVGLSVIGVAFIYSAQYSAHPGGLAHQGWMKQVAFLLAGAGLYVAVSLIDYRLWLSIAHWVYLICVIPLILVLMPKLGTVANGARRWLDLGLFSFQPSETANVGVLLITASILIRSKIGTVQQSLGVLGKLTLAVGGPTLLIVLEPDLKSAIVLPPMVFSMLYVSKLSARFFAVALGGFPAGRRAGRLGHPPLRALHDGPRLLVRDPGGRLPAPFLDSAARLSAQPHPRVRRPDKIDPMGIGWNRRQSLISVGSGGFTGKGWTKGTQAQLRYLPRSEAHNDFIFSVIAEEKGFLGSITVLGLFGIVLFNGIRIAGLARDRFGTLLALGVTVLFAVHVFVTSP